MKSNEKKVDTVSTEKRQTRNVVEVARELAKRSTFGTWEKNLRDYAKPATALGQRTNDRVFEAGCY